MTELIRIPNIENYTQEIINGELILTPKKNNTLQRMNLISRRLPTQLLKNV
jgi:hypothetical protein